MSAEVQFQQQEFNSQENIFGYASVLHNKWRETQQLTDGLAVDGLPKRKERMKLSDPSDPGSDMLDIANTPFENLPNAWKEKNISASEKAMNDIQHITDDGMCPVVDIEETSAKTHREWKNRNTWAEGEQAGMYSDMSIAEKNKDREILLGATEYLVEQGFDIKAVNKGWMYEDSLNQEIAEARSELDALDESGDVDAIRRGLQKQIGSLEWHLKKSKYVRNTDVNERYPRDSYKQEKGTEGALLSTPIFPEGVDDPVERNGYKNGESVEEKSYREKVELLIELSEVNPMCLIDAYNIANERLSMVSEKIDDFAGKTVDKSSFKGLNQVKSRYEKLLGKISEKMETSNLDITNDSKNKELFSEDEIQAIRVQWMLGNLRKFLEEEQQAIAEVENKLANEDIHQSFRERLLKEKSRREQVIADLNERIEKLPAEEKAREERGRKWLEYFAEQNKRNS